MRYTREEIADYLDELAAAAARARRERQRLGIVRPCDIKRPMAKVLSPSAAKVQAAREARVQALEGVAREQAIDRALRRSVKRIQRMPRRAA